MGNADCGSETANGGLRDFSGLPAGAGAGAGAEDGGGTCRCTASRTWIGSYSGFVSAR